MNVEPKKNVLEFITHNHHYHCVPRAESVNQKIHLDFERNFKKLRRSCSVIFFLNSPHANYTLCLFIFDNAFEMRINPWSLNIFLQFYFV